MEPRLDPQQMPHKQTTWLEHGQTNVLLENPLVGKHAAAMWTVDMGIFHGMMCPQ